MAPQRRERIEPTDDWQQRALRVKSAEQRRYDPMATGTPARTDYRQVALCAAGHGQLRAA